MTIRWTPSAVAVATCGLAACLAGAGLGRPPLVLFGAALLAATLLDAFAVVRVSPRATLQVAPQRVAEGQQARVEARVEGLRPSQQVRVPLAGPLELAEGSNLFDGASPSAAFAVTSSVRGPQRVGPVEVRTWSPLRLWAAEHAAGGEQVLEVVPRVDDAAGIALRSRVVTPTQGRFQVNRPGQGFDFFALREYRSGDTMRSINWKATARRDDLIVNQRQMETHGEVSILLDARCVAGLGVPGQTPLDRGCRIALGLFTQALGHRDEVHFAAYGRDVQVLPPGHQGILERLEGLLARLEAGGETALGAAWAELRRTMSSASGPVILVTSAEADDSLPEAVRQMVGRGHAVTVISPRPDDDLLPPEDAARRAKRRLDMLSRLRDLGAAVKDWSGGPVEIEAPALSKVFR